MTDTPLLGKSEPLTPETFDQLIFGSRVFTRYGESWLVVRVKQGKFSDKRFVIQREHDGPVERLSIEKVRLDQVDGYTGQTEVIVNTACRLVMPFLTDEPQPQMEGSVMLSPPDTY